MKILLVSVAFLFVIVSPFASSSQGDVKSKSQLKFPSKWVLKLYLEPKSQPSAFADGWTIKCPASFGSQKASQLANMIGDPSVFFSNLIKSKAIGEKSQIKVIPSESSAKDSEKKPASLSGWSIHAPKAFGLDNLKLMAKAIGDPDKFFNTLIEKEEIKSLGKAPDFSLTSINGEKLSLAKLKGKVVVFNFWFLGCAPCLSEIPNLNGLVKEFAGKDVVFIAPSLDKSSDLNTFLDRNEFNYKVVADAIDFIMDKYGDGTGNIAFPVHIVIDREGNITYRRIGGLLGTNGNTDGVKELSEAIRKQLNNKSI